MKSPRRCETIPMIYKTLKGRPSTAKEIAARCGIRREEAGALCSKLNRLKYLKVVGRKCNYRTLAKVYAIAKPYVMRRTPRQDQPKSKPKTSTPRPRYTGLAGWGVEL